MEDTQRQISSEVHHSNDLTVAIFVADICDPISLGECFALIQQIHPQIDILVNNAAYYPNHGPIANNLEDAWRAFEVNVRGTLNVTAEFCRQAAGHDTKSSTRAIMNIVSASAYAFQAPGAAAYSASKAALIRIMEDLALERADIRVINVHPGVAQTDMWLKAGGDTIDIPINDGM